MALLLILESLSPTERAAYLLRRIFRLSVRRDRRDPGQARSRVAGNWSAGREARVLEKRPRFEADPAKVERLTEAFIQACSSGDLGGLVQILAADAVLYSDGGGKVAAAAGTDSRRRSHRAVLPGHLARKHRRGWRSGGCESTGNRVCSLCTKERS